MEHEASIPDDWEERLDEVIAQYLRDEGEGKSPNRDQLLAGYPDLATGLTRFFEGHDRLQGLVRPFVPRTSLNATASCPRCRDSMQTIAVGSTCRSCGWRFESTTEVGDPFPIGHRLGRIELIEVVGRGAFGTVYKAQDTELGRTVAVKALYRNVQATPHPGDWRKDLVAAQLDHPAIVRVYDTGLVEGIRYLVSEFIPGQTLSWRMRENRLTFAESAGLVAEIAGALEHAHANRIVHRDVKPSNILLKNDKLEPLLTDFGLALWDTEEASLTEDGRIVGTLAYMSPEQARGQGRVDGRSDVYSLGVILYELLTGERPFVGNVRGMLHQIEYDDPRPPRALDDRIPRDLETICLKCLQKDPVSRYGTARALAEDLRRYLEGRPVVARPVSRMERVARWAKRNPALSVVGGLSVVLLIATAVISVAWALHADRQTNTIQMAFDDSNRVQAETEFDRGLAEVERGDIGLGMHWMARALETAPTQVEDLHWAIRANLQAWRNRLVTLSDCLAPPEGKVLAFAPDGLSAWYVDPDRQTVRRWELATGTMIGPELRHPEGSVEFVAVSQDGDRIALGGYRGVSVWETTSGKPLFERRSIDVKGLACSASGREWIVGIQQERGEPKSIAFMNWDGGELRPIIASCRQAGPIFLSATPDGESLLSSGLGDTQFIRWERKKGQLRDRLLTHPGPIQSVAISSDGKQVLTGSGDRRARLWDLESGQLLAVLPHKNPLTAVAFDRSGKKLLTASFDDAIRVWSLPEKNHAQDRYALSVPIRSMIVNPSGDYVVTGTDDGKVRIWKIVESKLEATGQPFLHRGPVRNLTYSSQGSWLATTMYTKKGAVLWNMASMEQVASLAHPATIGQVCFSPDEKMVATVGYDGQIHVWYSQTGQPAFEKPIALGQLATAAAFRPDGAMLITTGEDHKARRWDMNAGVELLPAMPHGGNVPILAFHPTKPTILLTAGEDGVARLWDTDSGKPWGMPFPHGFAISVATFSLDGKTVLTGGYDGKTRVWDVSTGVEVERTLHHGGRIRAVSIHSMGRWAVTAGDDGMARIWAIHLGRPIGPPIRHNPSALCAVIDPADQWILTAGEDGTIGWQSAPKALVGDSQRIGLWLQLATGAELDSRGDLNPLDPPTWQARAKELRTLGGPP